MLHCSLHCRLKLEAIDGESSALGKIAILFLDRLGLDCVERNKGRQSSSLIPHVFDAINGSLFVLDHDGIEMASEYGHDGSVILAAGRFAQIDDSAVDTWD